MSFFHKITTSLKENAPVTFCALGDNDTLSKCLQFSTKSSPYEVVYINPPFPVEGKFKGRLIVKYTTKNSMMDFPVSPSFDDVPPNAHHEDTLTLYALGAFFDKNDVTSSNNFKQLCVQDGYITFLDDWKQKNISPPDGGFYEGRMIFFDMRVSWCTREMSL